MTNPDAAARAIDALLDRVLSTRRLVGAVVLILRDGEPFYGRAVGFADRESGTVMAVDTIFRLARRSLRPRRVCSASTIR
jgi:CubicO group peptidase (beta-lactamase class C family)